MSAMRACAAIALAIVTGQAARALSEPVPQQTPAFKTGVDLVQVDVSVLDRDRQPIRGLKAADFTVLEPGRYEIRAAVRDERGAKLGTIASYIEVPDFAQSPLSLSDVVLEVTPTPPAAPSSIFAEALPVVPSAQRTFAAADRVRAFVRVYQGRGRVEPVTLTVTIQDDRGKAVLDKKELLTPDMFGTERVADYLLDVPLESATAGTYRLRIVATRDARQASRDVRFVVEPTRRPPS